MSIGGIRIKPRPHKSNTIFTCFDGPLKKFNSAYSMCETTDTNKISIFRNTIQVISDMQLGVHETSLL
jgi:hypothetical protein